MPPEATVRRPRIVPRDAATLMIVDRSGPSPKVLMGRRHPGLAFMPGQFVFPGGRLERRDRFVPSVTELHSDVADRLGREVPAKSRGRERALALAALREAWEETGLVIGRRTDGVRWRPNEAAADPAWQAYAAAGVLPDLAAMAYVGRAITPPTRKRRFDTRFFAVDRTLVAADEPGHVGPDQELVELVWIEVAAADTLDVPRITAAMIRELAAWLGRDGNPGAVPFYRSIRGQQLRLEL